MTENTTTRLEQKLKVAERQTALLERALERAERRFEEAKYAEVVAKHNLQEHRERLQCQSKLLFFGRLLRCGKGPHLAGMHTAYVPETESLSSDFLSWADEEAA